MLSSGKDKLFYEVSSKKEKLNVEVWFIIDYKTFKTRL